MLFKAIKTHLTSEIILLILLFVLKNVSTQDCDSLISYTNYNGPIGVVDSKVTSATDHVSNILMTNSTSSQGSFIIAVIVNGGK